MDRAEVLVDLPPDTGVVAIEPEPLLAVGAAAFAGEAGESRPPVDLIEHEVPDPTAVGGGDVRLGVNGDFKGHR